MVAPAIQGTVSLALRNQTIFGCEMTIIDFLLPLRS